MRTFNKQQEAWAVRPPLSLVERKAQSWDCFECSILHVGPSHRLVIRSDVYRYCNFCAIALGLIPEPPRTSAEMNEYPVHRSLGRDW